jgi:SP family general alpha glucoside:H+ symporter-like MFS transporter
VLRSPQIPAEWQNGLSNGAQVGEILGLYAAGIVVDRWGYKKTMIGALMAMTAFIFIPFFSQNLQTLLAGEILQGIPWGVFQTMTTAYASEVAPVALRAYLTTYVNLCWVMGQLIASGVLRSLLDRADLGDWAWRTPFAIQWVWPIPIMVGVFFAPESPWWLVRKGRTEDARRAVLRLTSAGIDEDFNVDETVAMMIHTNEIEKSIAAGTSYIDCFKGVDGRRTEITSMTWVIQAFCGSAFMGYSTYFYQNAGLPNDASFDMSIGQFALGGVGTILSWFAMIWFGRRSLYVAGLTIMFILLLIIGFVGIVPSGNLGASWAIGSMLLIYTFVYDLTVGPVCYSLVAEIPSTRLKAKTVVLARNFYNIAGIINNIITPRMINPTAWNWGAKAGFFWAGLCFICLIWTYLRLPEPKGRTYGELDVLFDREIPARKFKGTQVDIFRSGELAIINSAGSAEGAPEMVDEKH